MFTNEGNGRMVTTLPRVHAVFMGLERIVPTWADLEVMVLGLQDAVHREAVRRDEQAARFERRIEPRELARALADDARERGL